MEEKNLSQKQEEFDEFKPSTPLSSIIGAIVVLLVVIGGLAFLIYYFMYGGKKGREYEEFQNKIFGPTHVQYHETFWKCAMNDPLEKFGTANALVERIMRNASDKGYEEHLTKNENCLPLLEKAIPSYQQLLSSPKFIKEYEPVINGLIENLKKEKESWYEYAEYLKGKGKRLETEKRIDTAGGAWLAYTQTKEERWLNSALTYVKFLSCLIDKPLGEIGGEGEAKVDFIKSKINELCEDDPWGFAVKVYEKCGEYLFPTEQLKPDDSFQKAYENFKGGIDHESALDIKECLEKAKEKHDEELRIAIAKALAEYRKNYNKLIAITREYTGKK